MPDPGASLLGQRSLLLFTGKGGVGKTSLVAGVALASAAAGRQPLIVELGHRASMEAIFPGHRIGAQPVQVHPGVSAVNLELDASLRYYFEEQIPVKRAANAIINNETLQRFFRAAPAVSEVATLNRLRSLVEGRGDSGPNWDPVIVDLDATGHALMLFNVPKVMHDLVGKGPLRPMIDGFASLFASRQQTALNLVTLARELPMQETRELLQTLRSEHEIPLGLTVVNQMPKDPLSPPERDLLSSLLQSPKLQTQQTLLLELSRLSKRCSDYEHAAKLKNAFVQELQMPHVVLERENISTVRTHATLQQMGQRLLDVQEVAA